MSNTGRLNLPYIESSQAQKEVSHNEALNRLDTLVQGVIIAIQNTPPSSVLDGDCYIVGTAPTDAWSGNINSIARWLAGGWYFIAPQLGWRFRHLSAKEDIVYESGGWYSYSSGSSSSPAVVAKLYRSSIIALGDSETAGYPYIDNCPADDLDVYSWTNVIRNYLNISIHNKGIGGQTTAELLARMPVDVIANKPTHCIIEGGINDIVHTEKAVSVSGTMSNYQAMIALCKTNNIIPIVAIAAPISTTSPYVTASMVTDYKSRMATLRSYCNANDIPLIDFYPQFIENVSGNIITSLIYSGDNLHPNSSGYIRMGHYAVYRLKQILPEFIGTLSPMEDYFYLYPTGMSPQIDFKTGAVVFNGAPVAEDHTGFACSEGGSPGNWLSTGRLRKIFAVAQNATKIILQTDTADRYWHAGDVVINWDASTSTLSGYEITVAGYSMIHSVVSERATFVQKFSFSAGGSSGNVYQDSYSSPNLTRSYPAGSIIFFPDAPTGSFASIQVLTAGYSVNSPNTPHITYTILGVK